MSWPERLLSLSARYKRDLGEAELRFAAANAQHSSAEANRQKLLSNLRADHEAANAEELVGIRERNSEVDQMEAGYLSGEPGTIVAYCSLVLNNSRYPEGVPCEGKTAYLPASRELVIDFELPTADIVPQVGEYRYVKTKDLIEEKPRKPTEIKNAYRDVVAAVALRTISEVLRADQGKHIDIVVFSGFVNAVDPATGQNVRPYLISVRTTRQRFSAIDLGRIEKKACLRNLGAQVSPQPAELQPVKPLVEFDMVDKRFVEGADVLVDLESRPNLMDLTPFESSSSLATSLQKWGLIQSKRDPPATAGRCRCVRYTPCDRRESGDSGEALPAHGRSRGGTGFFWHDES